MHNGEMTPTTNEQAVEDLYDAYGARNLERFLALLHPDVEWELANWLGGGVRHGRISTTTCDCWTRSG